MKITKTTSPRKLLSILALAASAFTFHAATPSVSQALVLHNCLENGGVGVRVTGQTTGKAWTFRLEPNQRKALDTGRGEKFRLNLNPIGPDKQFSGWNGNDVLSIRRIAGNVEVSRGVFCSAPVVTPPTPTPAPSPAPGGGNQGKICFEGVLGRVCIQK